MSEDQSVQIALLKADVDQLKAAVELQTKQTAELVQAWNTASGVLSFVKMLGGIAIAVTAITLWFKGFRL